MRVRQSVRRHVDVRARYACVCVCGVLPVGRRTTGNRRNTDGERTKRSDRRMNKFVLK
jgi:hypothetical protein